MKFGNKLKIALQRIVEWKQIFTLQTEKHNKFKLKLIQQLAIEQELYSKIYGIKGKVDSVCLFEDLFGKREIYAIELKTGVIQKKAYEIQVMIYSLLLKSVYDNASSHNMIVYINEQQKTELVYWREDIIIKIIQFRNKMIRSMIGSSPEYQIKIGIFKSIIIGLDSEIASQRRIRTIDSGFKMVKLISHEEGYRIGIAKELRINKKGIQDYLLNLYKYSKFTLRPKDSTIVFNNAFIENIKENNTTYKSKIVTQSDSKGSDNYQIILINLRLGKQI